MKILIDNGHGRETPGKCSFDGRLLEYAQNSLLARGIGKIGFFAKFAWFIVMQDMRRIEWEKRTVRHMIELWCRGKHGGNNLCEECQSLLDYSLARLEHCRFGEKKTKCHKCAVHCYRPEMRARIREVMRYSGPRMILCHPLEALRYMISR